MLRVMPTQLKRYCLLLLQLLKLFATASELSAESSKQFFRSDSSRYLSFSRYRHPFALHDMRHNMASDYGCCYGCCVQHKCSLKTQTWEHGLQTWEQLIMWPFHAASYSQLAHLLDSRAQVQADGFISQALVTWKNKSGSSSYGYSSWCNMIESTGCCSCTGFVKF